MTALAIPRAEDEFASPDFPGVRIAGPRDAQAIFNLLVELYRENAIQKISERKVWGWIQRATSPVPDESQLGIIGVIDGEKEIEASIGMFLSELWYTEDKHIDEFWNYVRPQYRRSSHAKIMIEFGKWCAIRLTTPLLMGIISNIRTEAKVRLYSRQLPFTGAFFWYGVTPKDLAATADGARGFLRKAQVSDAR